METDGDIIEGDNPSSSIQFDGEEVVQSSNFYVDQVGEVALTLNSDGLSWKLIESLNKDGSTCLAENFVSKSETSIKFSDVYAVDFINYGLVHESVLANAGGFLLGCSFELYHFTVHGVQRSKTQPCLWVPSVYTFGHKDLNTCQIWVNRINAYIGMEVDRPKSLLVFVHPRSGKGNGFQTWESVAPIFSQAKVKTKVIVTQRAGHAFDVMAALANKELSLYDGVVAVGGDGFFNEILNGLLLSRHKAPYPPAPTDFGQPNAGTGHDSFETDRDSEFSFPNERFRFGIIPSGSTDAIVICTTGTRDPVTSALQIILGKRVCLDIAQIVRWKTTSTSEDELCVRYAASFAGYGFYGDVIKKSEKYRWMGPKRYDYAGTKVFLKHRSYEAEVAYLEAKSEKSTSSAESVGSSRKSIWSRTEKSERVICRANCKVCNTEPDHVSPRDSKWVRSKGRFLSIGAAIMSNRNEKAPDGLVADAHLSDGFLHLILIKDCPHALYLWHLTQLAMKGGTPLDFEFVEHHKTSTFTFTSFGEESVWNVDGELFEAHKLSAQVFHGLISLFATGPEV